MYIIKRNGSRQEFNPNKINKAISSALQICNCSIENPSQFIEISEGDSVEVIQDRIENLQPEDMDDMIEPSVYDNNQKHVELVVKDVLDNWDKRSRNSEYNALFTTHVGGNKASTPMAMMFYKEFKKQTKLRKKPLKIGITFSQDNSNSDNQLENNMSLEEAIKDYNEQFGTSFGVKDAKEYTEQLV